MLYIFITLMNSCICVYVWQPLITLVKAVLIKKAQQYWTGTCISWTETKEWRWLNKLMISTHDPLQTRDFKVWKIFFLSLFFYQFFFRWSALWNTENKCLLLNKAINISVCTQYLVSGFIMIFSDLEHSILLHLQMHTSCLTWNWSILLAIICKCGNWNIILLTDEVKFTVLLYFWFCLSLLLCLFVYVCLCFCLCPHHVLFNHRTVDRSERT